MAPFRPYRKPMPNPTQPKIYRIGDNLTKDEVASITSGQNKPGWYDVRGQRVYICDGAHRDGFFGFKVLDLGGLK